MNDLYGLTVTCCDINNDGYLLKSNIQIVFGNATFPLDYAPKFNGKEALNITGITWASTDNRFGSSSFGDFNGDGLIDMAVTNGNYSSYEVYIIFGKQNENWPSSFDVKSRNSSNVIAFTKGSGSKSYNCDSLMMGDINANGFDDLQCFSPDFVWVVYGNDLPFESVVDLSATTSPLVDECRGLILEQVDGKVLANADFNNDKILDLMVIKSNILYGIYGEKLPMSASLGLIDTILEYSANGSYILLEDNYSPVSGKCPLTSIKYLVYVQLTIHVLILCVPPGTTDINAGCAKYPCTYGLECNSTVNKCVLPSACMSGADLKCGSNEKCELRKSRNAKICKLFPFCLDLRYGMKSTSFRLSKFSVVTIHINNHRFSCNETFNSKIKENLKAQEKYDDSIASGGQGFMISREDNGVIKISLGNIEPKKHQLL
ncbi:type A von Willebrand factor domain-containing protein [Tieghemostelium lacteum]|uniref:Type A von Willebrand factor domain-containing protein n=1 Tax=Tieghemostelium lacteum TaxID=361077 RepID=A0A151ZED6_TIELA|nr:type A von Willebrand factor domain-containing protein [Tieghemostelium lacteum]|eukprot:KYQ92279.1 type A von Willebrand factor domain-containing protein [Tieghemostelium lacteum]